MADSRGGEFISVDCFLDTSIIGEGGWRQRGEGLKVLGEKTCLCGHRTCGQCRDPAHQDLWFCCTRGHRRPPHVNSSGCGQTSQAGMEESWVHLGTRALPVK